MHVIDPEVVDFVKREFVAGGAAGSIGIFIGYPFDIVKVNLQVLPDKYPTAWSCFTQICREDGVLGLYRGCMLPLLMQGLINSFMFTGESVTLRFLEHTLLFGEVGGQLNQFIAGCAGGLSCCIPLVPCEVIKCRLQTSVSSSSSICQTNKSSLKIHLMDTAYAVRHLYLSEGGMGFYRGLGATLLREVPSIGIYFSVYKGVREYINRFERHRDFSLSPDSPPSTLSTLLAGGSAGAVSWAIIYPFDVIKTNAQICIGDRPTTWQMGATLYRRYGGRVFYRGLGTTMLRAFPVNASTFYFYEHFKTLLKVQ